MVNCHLIEMQQRNACLIHSGEYFHGPFETTGKGVAIVLLMSTGRTLSLIRISMSSAQARRSCTPA